MHEFVASAAWSVEDVDYFLDPTTASWARFDPVTGYLPADVRIRDGVGDAHTLSTYGSDGARSMTRHADRPCRIDTFGDSFTQCHQVSDGETWQEVLASHLGEPVRNFGVGGYGVYQALCRLRARAATGDLAPNVILNIYDDDHVRNLDAARWFRLHAFGEGTPDQTRPMLHANPWAHLRWDTDASTFVERPNPLPTPAALYRFADVDAVVDRFGDDDVVALECLRTGVAISGAQLARLRDLSMSLGHSSGQPDLSGPGVEALMLDYGLRSTLYTLDLVRELVERSGARLLVLLSYSAERICAELTGQPRFDQVLVDYLQTRAIPYVDALQAHARDARDFALPPQRYVRRYLNGHYTPAGNAFFAEAIRAAVVDWLDPKPPAYPGADAPFAIGLLS